jgi:hypothetical protein
MYLSEEKRAAIRACIENQNSNSEINSKENKAIVIKGTHKTEDVSKVSQILFDARDGKEVFTPF